MARNKEREVWPSHNPWVSRTKSATRTKAPRGALPWSRQLYESRDPWSVILRFEERLRDLSPNMAAYAECRRAHLAGKPLPGNLHTLRLALRWLVHAQQQREAFMLRPHPISYDPRPRRPPEAYREIGLASALLAAIELLESQEGAA